MFNQFDLHERLLKALAQIAFTKPTAIQTKAIPLIQQGHDLFITAQTGTGKTAAFILPVLQHLLENTQPGSGLHALIILPTRELATQTYKEMQRFSRYTFLESLLVTGGEGLKEQAAKLRKNPDIVIGTPGRLIEHWKNKQLILEDIQLLVLDEADRTLDMGFGEDVVTLVNNCPPNKQTLLISATQGGESLQTIVKELLKNPQQLHIHEKNQLNSNIAQQVILADDLSHKERLMQWLLAHEAYEQAIIFANTRAQADRLGQILDATHIKNLVLHSEKTHQERKQGIDRLHQSHVKILIATDVAARGLDIDKVDLIINFDLPNTTDEYVHRIGRTGRIGKTGTAISLINAANWNTLLLIEKTLQPLERRVISALKGKFEGLNKTKPQTSKILKPTATAQKGKTKEQSHPKKVKTPVKTSTLVSADGFAPLKKKK